MRRACLGRWPGFGTTIGTALPRSLPWRPPRQAAASRSRSDPQPEEVHVKFAMLIYETADDINVRGTERSEELIGAWRSTTTR